jgi:hypothetical protein
MAFPFNFNPGVQAIAAFIFFVIGFLLLVFAIVVCTALAILVYEGVHQVRARVLEPSARDSDDLANTGVPKVHVKSVAILAWKDGLREGLLGNVRHQ